MSNVRISSRHHWILGAVAVSVFGLILLGGCPQPTVPDNGGNGDPNTGGGGIDDIPGSGDGSGGGGSGDGGSGGGGGGSGGGGDTGGNPPDKAPPTSFALTDIAATGDPVPDQPSGTTFTQFGEPVIDGQGRVAFWALFTGASARGNGGLYVWDGTTLKRIVHDDPSVTGIVPGRTTADYFGDFDDGADSLALELAWAGGDRLLFNSEVSGEKRSQGLFRWKATDESIVRVADREQVIAFFTDAVEAAFAPDFDTPSVSDAGFAIFGVSYTYFTQPPGSQVVTGRGVFRSNGLELTLLADSNLSASDPGKVPGQGASAFYSFPDTLTTVNASGDWLFQSLYASGDGTRGLYLVRGDTTYRVIDSRTGAAWPGLPSDAAITSAPMLFAIGPAGHIALETTLSTGGSTRPAVLQWDFSIGNWGELTGQGGAPGMALVSGINNDGEVAMLSEGQPYVGGRASRKALNASLPAELQGATVTWKGSGGSINNQGRAVLPYSLSGADGLAFWNGTDVLIVADVTSGIPAGITDITTATGPERDRPGRSGLLNDTDEVVFRAVTGSGEAIYIARGQ